MPAIRPIHAVCFARAVSSDKDVSDLIAPPYDVLDEAPKRDLLARDEHNIVAIDLPFTPPKVVGPDEVYARAGQTYRQWLSQGVLAQLPRPALFVYEQAYSHSGRSYQRRGLIANLRVQDFGRAPDGQGGIWPHEQTFASGKEDRLKLMRACRAQLSPIFGIYRDPQAHVGELLRQTVAGQTPSFEGTTANDQVHHRVWQVSTPSAIEALATQLSTTDAFIADGHHRYATAINYRNELAAATGGLPENHPANFCMFVLVAMEDPGLIILPTHRVLGGMRNFSLAGFSRVATGKLNVTPFTGRSGDVLKDLRALEAALPKAGPHAVGCYAPCDSSTPLAIITTLQADPLAKTHAARPPAWRQLDVAIVQHLIVEQVCQPAFCAAGQQVKWKYPHELGQLAVDAQLPDYQVGLIVQPTPLSAVSVISQAGELMPQKSTFFYPKLATGLVINPLE